MVFDRIPGLRDAEWSVTYEQLALVSQVSGDAATHESVRLLFNLSVNDFRDLLHDLGSGSGRSAIRAARAVIEHAINLRTVGAGLAEASRYVEHLDQGPTLLRGLATGADRLTGAYRRSYERSLEQRARPARRRFEAAVAEHGAWFERGWTQMTLKDRATLHGLAHLYDYYKLASLVAHGSSGGSVGSVRDHPSGFRTFRTGPALELAPIAMWAGLAAYREILAGLELVRPDLETNAYLHGVDALDAMWPDYLGVITDIDKELWPDERVRPPRAILAFTRNGRRRWYLHLPMLSSLIQAVDPVLPAEVERQVQDLIDLVIDRQPYMFRIDQRWLTAEVPHVTVTPAPKARAIPEGALLETPPAGWEPRVIGKVNDGRDHGS